METDCTDNSNWLFDYGLIEGEDYTGALPATTCFSWPSQALWNLTAHLGIQKALLKLVHAKAIFDGMREILGMFPARAKNGPRRRILFLRGRSFEFQEESVDSRGHRRLGIVERGSGLRRAVILVSFEVGWIVKKLREASCPIGTPSFLGIGRV
ncbi:hypothetical protein CsSME_00027095 [Camellia sinensis var. sinensis]